MIKKLNENDSLKFKTLDPEYKKSKGVLGRLFGPVASCVKPTRNQRKYSSELWEKLFESDLIKERFRNGGIFGQLCHPDYEEVDMEKIACVMPEPPVKDKNGELVAYIDIVDTPCGRIAYQLAKYGYKFGISSRGSGDLIDGPDGDEVDPDTYQLTAFDLVEIPAVEDARLSFVESLDTKKKNGKTLKQRLSEEIEKAPEDERKIMEESLENLNIKLDESSTRAWLLRTDGTTIPQVVHTKLRSNSIDEVINNKDIQEELKNYYELTNNKEAKNLIGKLFNHIESGSDDLDTMNYLYKLIFDNFNNEFCKVRVGGMYGDEGESEIYFRISSKDVNWFDAISKFMMSHKNVADYITVMSDIEILHKEVYKKLNGKEIKHMPVNEFIMAKGNPVVESKPISEFEYNLFKGNPIIESYGKSNYIGHISNRFDSIEDLMEKYNLNDMVKFKLNESTVTEDIEDDVADAIDELEADGELSDEPEVYKYEALWYDNPEMNGDYHTEEFDSEEDLMNFYNEHKNDEDKFNWWLTSRDEDWSVIDDILTESLDTTWDEFTKKNQGVNKNFDQEKYGKYFDDEGHLIPELKSEYLDMLNKDGIGLTEEKKKEIVNEQFYVRHNDIDKAKDALLNKVDHEELLRALIEKGLDDKTIEALCRQFGIEDKEFGFNLLTPDEAKAKFGDNWQNELKEDFNSLEDAEKYAADHNYTIQSDDEYKELYMVTRHNMIVKVLDKFYDEWAKKYGKESIDEAVPKIVSNKEMLNKFVSHMKEKYGEEEWHDKMLELLKRFGGDAIFDMADAEHMRDLDEEFNSLEDAEKYADEHNYFIDAGDQGELNIWSQDENGTGKEIVKTIDKFYDEWHKKYYKESISESCGDKEVVNKEAGNAGDELVNQLQETLTRVSVLEKDNLSLQEKLSVSNAKEVKLEEELKKYKTSTISLSETAKKVRPLSNKVDQLAESLKKKDGLLQSNKFGLKKKDLRIKNLNQVNEDLNKQVENLTEELEAKTSKLEESTLTIKKYQRALKESREAYVEAKAIGNGLHKEDILSKLNESYSLKDVDKLCESISEEKHNLGKLPFRINEGVKLNFKPSKEYIGGNTSKSKFDDDYVSDYLKEMVSK